MWAPQRETLSREYRVTAPDLPGHGTRAGEPFEMETAVRTLDRVVGSFPNERPRRLARSRRGRVRRHGRVC